MKKIYKVLSLIVAMTVVMSCNLSHDLNSPNDVGVSAADPDLLMNKAQADFGLFYAKIGGNHNILTRGVNQLVRFKAMQGDKIYDRAFRPQDFDEIWKDSYQKVLVNLETLIPLAEEKQLNVHVGVAKILKALTYITLVDVFGDVPYTDALKGTDGNFNPAADPGASVYAAAIALLGEAKISLANTAGLGLTRDIYYNGSRTLWTTLANSIELKAQLNLTADPGTKAAAVARIQALIAADDLIDKDSEEFTYKWGIAAVPSISRNPTYQEYYSVNAGQAGGNIGNKFMQQMYRGLGVQDPRWRYYFYRQIGSRPQALRVDPNSIGCSTSPPAHYIAAGEPFCFVEPGFMGRDHGNNLGTNPDGAVLTCVGAYPYGGKIDTNDGDPNYSVPAKLGDGGNGKGIENIFMSWFTDFMKAEMVLSGMITGDAKALMISGVNKSINRTRSFANSLGLTLPAGLEPSPITYTATLGGKYDVSTDQKDLVLNEYWKSLWGNGLEAYNMYRRTGSPKNLQVAIAAAPGEFVYSMIYPSNFVNLNSSAAQKKDQTTRVFWDKTGLTLK
jgi:hypothetical protein